MDDIVAQVQNVTQLIAQISHSTLEQSDGLSSLTRAVNELSNITQKNAELVEERPDFRDGETSRWSSGRCGYGAALILTIKAERRVTAFRLLCRLIQLSNIQRSAIDNTDDFF